ncbi:MAG TPA: MmcQ/YjbR family DNA-binding protein [Planctomycetota bacterium]|nr:MmcQ/YjbR family DNA-binding protein [Planctomycetota bacterium]
MTSSDLSSPVAAAALAVLRRRALAFDGVAERMSWGHPNWFTKRGMFVAIGEDRGGVSIGFNLSPQEQALLLGDPRFFMTPYVGKKGWTSLRVDGPLDLALLDVLLDKAYARVAPKAPRAAAKAPPSLGARAAKSAPPSAKRAARSTAKATPSTTGGVARRRPAVRRTRR